MLTKLYKTMPKLFKSVEYSLHLSLALYAHSIQFYDLAIAHYERALKVYLYPEIPLTEIL